MVVCEVQDSRPGYSPLPGRVPLLPTGPRATGTAYTRSPVGEGVILVREPDAGNPPVRFDERDVETEHGKATKTPATERVGNCYATPKPPRHVSTPPRGRSEPACPHAGRPRSLDSCRPSPAAPATGIRPAAAL